MVCEWYPHANNDNNGRKGSPTQALKVGDDDIIFVMFMSDGNFRVFVITICKFRNLHSDIRGGEEGWVING